MRVRKEDIMKLDNIKAAHDKALANLDIVMNDQAKALKETLEYSILKFTEEDVRVEKAKQIISYLEEFLIIE